VKGRVSEAEKKTSAPERQKGELSGLSIRHLALEG